ncbi:hypothetical protein K8B33_08520 [Alcanivorax sp. JB21]|uniref:hypothetical protein n=1 Tax=Alcanivorax limicola TaxID=2874102 RepID=UPI001CBDCA4B|nr:hypothetical protein [Alcanivorax limicola]MBZ2189139.1 hypothetical protein [Alcanivorax limicola]
MIVDIYSEDKEIVAICSDYWALGDGGQFVATVAEITNKYGINSATLLKIVSNNSSAFSEDMACPVCGEMYQFKNRSDCNTFIPVPGWVCDTCVAELKEAQEQEFRDRLKSDYESCANKNIEITSLGFREIAYLLAVIRRSAAEDLSYILPHEENRTATLSPEFEFDIEILRKLYREGLIAISPLSDLDAFELNNEGGFTFYVTRVAWNFVMFEDAKSPRSIIEKIEALLASGDYRDDRHNEIVELAREISLLECLSYLEYVVAEHQLSFTAGEKTKIVLNQVLDNFSVAQAYNLIWRAAKDAAAFYMRSGANRKHAANTIVGNIQRQLDRAVANNWEVNPFRRNYDKPQSILSQVLFNTCLRTDDGGFSEPLWKLI